MSEARTQTGIAGGLAGDDRSDVPSDDTVSGVARTSWSRRLRKWHYIIAPFFAVFLLALALTGLAIQATDLIDHATARPHVSAKADTAGAAPSGGAVAAGKPAKEKRSAWGKWTHFFKKIHSGEAFGPAGIAINMAAGAALLFFAASGFWMYLSMALKRWSRRR